jgi:peptidoglycan/LPS O-acetylase OafA/YrhL
MSEKAVALSESEGLIEQADSIAPHITSFRPRAFFPSRSATIRFGRRLLFFLLPTFVQERWIPTVDPGTYKRLHPTAWLDGIRGLAAFLVFLDHLSYSTHDVYTAWGAEGRNHEFLKLPFVRFIYNGAAMVAIFFVVSGYALSYKPVRQMRNAEWEPLMQTFSSSVFRRAARLYLPCLASTLMIVALVRFGLYEWTREFASDPVRLPGNHEHHPWRYNTLSEQLYVWFSKMCSFMNPFTLEIKVGDAAIDIDGHLWTVCVEYVSCTTSIPETGPN